MDQDSDDEEKQRNFGVDSGFKSGGSGYGMDIPN